MIKYFCDFCKKEMQMNFVKPDVEVNVTITMLVTQSNRTTQKAEHICPECNDMLITSLSGLGLEVDPNVTTA